MEIEKSTEMCLSIKRFSNSNPDFFDTTGSSGTSPETVGTVKNKENRGDQQKKKVKIKPSTQH